MPLNLPALEAAQKALVLHDVYFRDEQVALDPELTPGFIPPAPHVHFKMTTGLLHDFTVEGQDGDGQTVSVRFLEAEFKGHVRCRSDQSIASDTPDVLRIEVSLGLLYRVVSECNQDCIEEFVRANVPFHAIPYWREHVHAVCAKRRLPPITVPMYQRFPPADRDTEAESHAPSNARMPADQ